MNVFLQFVLLSQIYHLVQQMVRYLYQKPFELLVHQHAIMVKLLLALLYKQLHCNGLTNLSKLNFTDEPANFSRDILINTRA